MRKFLVILLVGAFAATGLSAKEKKGGETTVGGCPAGESRWSGTIVRSDKEGSTLTVRHGTVERIIHYSSSTKWTSYGKPAEGSEFKDGLHVICCGRYGDKKAFDATRIDLREPKP